MNYIGISSGFHDAAMTVIDNNGNILFAGHSERYSKVKHDKELCQPIIEDAHSFVGSKCSYHYYERPWLKKLRQLRSGEPISKVLRNRIHFDWPYKSYNHHLSHAAASFQTSVFDHATVVVIDAIGEFDTVSIWHAEYDSNKNAKYKKLWSLTYPDSLGLFYSAMTKRVGLKPLDEEYILMGMAAYGKDLYSKFMEDDLVDGFEFKKNLHIGVEDNYIPNANHYDIAASSQVFLESILLKIMQVAKEKSKSTNLVYSGGVALNCLANRLLGNYFNQIWIMPNPGDAGSSLGAAALGCGKRLNWNNAYLGFNISGEYPVDHIYNELIQNKIAGVASGRAEFGPRALGNRSLLADPRGPEIKDAVNQIKRRQKFRPFAPVILEEYVHDYFEMPINWKNSRYMQVVATCRLPEKYPAIIHADQTSRVQTVPDDDSGIRKLLEKWFKETGCPMLLNTSLNIRGEPMVNDLGDAKRFERMYNVKVFS